MKNVMLFSCLLVLGILAQAKTITLEVPDKLFGSSTTINGNFDGSITIENPKVFYNGSYTYLNNTEDTVHGICFLLNKKFVSSLNYSYDRYVEAVTLNRNGELIGTELVTYPIKSTICK